MHKGGSHAEQPATSGTSLDLPLLAAGLYLACSSPTKPACPGQLYAVGCQSLSNADRHTSTHTLTQSLPISLTHSLPHTQSASLPLSISPAHTQSKSDPDPDTDSDTHDHREH